MIKPSVELPAGKYVVAVSGGVDSMVLLDLLSKQKDLQLVVAHYHHGIRGADADADEALVQRIAARYRLPFESAHGELGANASEAEARTARYMFLLSVQRQSEAEAIVLAHHRDDVVETVLINLLRGTGWRGLSSLRSHDRVRRPLLTYDKAALMAYAETHAIEWREDQTNTDPKYLRNHVRHTLIPELQKRNPKAKAELFKLHMRQVELEGDIARQVDSWFDSHMEVAGLPRYEFIMLPHDVGLEILQMYIKRQTGQRVLSARAEAALLFAKVAKPGTIMQLGNSRIMQVTANRLIVAPVNR